jgi:protein-S-isoprenylcysteine O-methyltransferase Ste14
MVLRSFLTFFSVVLLSFALLIVSSGNPLWIGAWTIFGFDCLYFIVLLTIGRKHFPETVHGRAQTKFVHTWDKAAILIYSISYYSQYLISGLTYRFSVTTFQPNLYIPGIILYAIGFGITFWVFAVNPYATGSSRIQEERNQKLVSSGPYRIIRHPMYFATVIFTLSIPLVLCSLWAYIPAPVVIGSFIYRTYREDAMLMNELEGYRAYAQGTRFRMIPFIW